MKIKDLPNCPEWLVLANTKDADVEWSPFGNLLWNGGQFLGGEFRGGQFLGGEFRGGQFLGGEFRGGYFLGGEFRGGQFLGGEFRGGEFRGGEFLGGQFLGGYFLGGVMVPSCKWVYGVMANGKIKIGCKEKTTEEWDTWFSSSEEYSTRRDSIEFKRIEACYKLAKAFLEADIVPGLN